MAADGTVIIDTELDTSGVEKGSKDLQQKLSKIGEFAGKSLAVIGGAAVAGATAVVGFSKKVVEAYGELEQNIGGTEAVFGDFAKNIQQTASEAYKKMGASASQYMAIANKMGALFQGSGLEQRKSLELTTAAMQRAADVASIMGIDVQFALDSVAGAAKGNFTMMDNLGVAMSATTIEAYAMAQGFNKTWKEMSQAEKVEWAMKMFFERTAQYAGNFEREATQTITGAFGMLKAAVQDFIAGLGNADADMQTLSMNMVNALNSVVENVTPILENLVSALPEALKSIIPAVIELAPLIFDAFVQTLMRFAEMGDEVAEVGVQLIMSLIDGISATMPQVAGTLLEVLDKVMDHLDDIGPELIDVAVDAITDFTKGIVKAFPKLTKTFLKLVAQLISSIAKQLPDMIDVFVDAIIDTTREIIKMLPKLVEAGIELVVALVTGIVQALPQLIKEVPRIITEFVDALVSNIDMIVDAGVQLLMGIVMAIPEISKELILAVPQIIEAIVTGLMRGTVQIFASALEAFGVILDAGKAKLEEFNTMVQENVGASTEWADAWSNAKEALAGVEEVLSSSGKTMAEIDDEIKNLQENINTILSTAAQERRTLRADELADIEAYNTRIIELQQEQLDAYLNQLTVTLTKVNIEGTNITAQTAANLLKEAKVGYDSIVNYADQVYNSKLLELEKEKASIIEQYGEEEYQKRLEAAKEFYDNMISEADASYQEIMSTIQETTQAWIEGDKSAYEELLYWNEEYNKKKFEYVNTKMALNKAMTADEAAAAFDMSNHGKYLAEQMQKCWKQIIDAQDGATVKSAAAWLNMLATAKEQGGRITVETRNTAKGMLESFMNLPKDLQESGKATLLGMISGLEDKIPELSDTSEMSAEEIVVAVERYLGIMSPSKVMQDIGHNVVDGLILGMEDQQRALTMASKGMGETVEDGLKSGLGMSAGGISTAMKNIGRNVINGLIEGLNDRASALYSRAREIANRVKSIIQQAFDVKSPSRWAIWVGKNVGAPLGESMQESFLESVRGFATTLEREQARIGSMVAAGAGAGAQTIIDSRRYEYSYIYQSPEPLDTNEIIRQQRLDEQRRQLLRMD